MSRRRKIAPGLAVFALLGIATTVAAYEMGAGSGTPLLSIHGAGGGYDPGLLIATGLVGQPAAEYAAAHIPGARLIVYPTGGHLFIRHSTDVRNAVAGFLAGL